MAKFDIITKNYFQNKNHFADLFNYKLYNGKQLIQPDSLKPFDSTEVIVPYGNQTQQPIQLFRDNVNIWASMQNAHTAFIILGIESQTDIHYAMPVRNMLYDSANYAGQVRLAELLQKDPLYSRMERESANLINIATNSKLLYSMEGDEINMCKAVEDMKEDARIETNLTAIKNVMESIHVTVDKAMEILKIDPEKRQEYASMIR